MKTLFKKFALLALTGLLFSAPCSAGIVTFSATGTITEGRDSLNVFDAGLHAGAAYRHSISLDTDLLTPVDLGWGVNHSGGNGQAATVTTMIELGGKSFAWQWSGGDAYAYLWNYFPWYGFAQGGLSGQIIYGSGSFIISNIDMRSNAIEFLDSIDFGKTRVFHDLSGIDAYSTFTLSTEQGQSWFIGKPDTLTWQASPVPEPGSMSLLLIGAFSLAALRNRRRG